jgi:hypothetical protein
MFHFENPRQWLDGAWTSDRRHDDAHAPFGNVLECLHDTVIFGQNWGWPSTLKASLGAEASHGMHGPWRELQLYG